ncbi:MAG: nucleotidyltransferase domain-containing protein [Acidobacteria bacterium]|uniref:Phosphoenolpyruvate synthase n=1 Tax=Candidatus Polarisedimenticola svalbardensis TaxID=2886004 RepID=A0A8J7CKI1_9BACT|nr:nucleotidyltransferase domain-containing protein [Candidatus Polarisedimenticola svalbardensis]
MAKRSPMSSSLLDALHERAKELNCLYQVDEILNKEPEDLAKLAQEFLATLPAGWQYPDSCQARIQLTGQEHATPGYLESPWKMMTPIIVEGETVGELELSYKEQFPPADEGPFLKEERRLISAIAERVGHWVSKRKLERAMKDLEAMNGSLPEQVRKWNFVLGFLRSTDHRLLLRITRRLINHLCVQGIEEAEEILQQFTPGSPSHTRDAGDDNQPLARTVLQDIAALTDRAFKIAARELTDDELVGCIQSWMREDKAGFLYESLENMETSLADLGDAIVRYHSLNMDENELPLPVRTGLRVALLRRYFSDKLQFLNKAKDVVRVGDFYELVQHTISPARGHGKLGGKSSGLFTAKNIIKYEADSTDLLKEIRTPRTWYIASDATLQFIRYNNLEDIYYRKYCSIDQIRQEYPNLVQVFKNSAFPPEIVNGLSAVLDEFSDVPIIVRSSSLLEDQSGAAFSGKYKSLFLANLGSKKERLAALQDAIAEVYASIFGPDPIEYRAQRGLLDVHEEMGIMIQEVVGTKVGPYFLPAFSGVALSNNEFRWSSRIKQDDGLVRLVPGLGTRAVDRLGDDYPILVAPGQPGLRVNVTLDEVLRYSPRYADAINLETRSFETVDFLDLIKTHGDEFPMLAKIVSEITPDGVRQPIGFSTDFAEGDFAVTFESLLSGTPFIAQIRTMLKLLEEKLDTPVDLEFASDGTHLYLLQCRPQSYSRYQAPAAIPRDIPRERILFSADRYVSNGYVPDVTHIVYVDPDEYAQLQNLDDLKEVGRTVSRLNTLLPKRQFILMGPGRWGSRGDITLGVNVTYSDINNTSMLVEIAQAKGGYVPDLSFGTHFFQDLVEAEIRYLPLYPDEDGIIFSESFFRCKKNILAELLPEAEHLSQVVKVIDLPRVTEGKILRVLLNADLDEAIGVLSEPTATREVQEYGEEKPADPFKGVHWNWRMRMAERIAGELGDKEFGIKAAYVFGSTKNATAGPGSDLDMILHFNGTKEQEKDLMIWLDGWSQALAEMNYLRTGYVAKRLLDVHLITDDDIRKQNSYASKIGAVTDAARELPISKP